MGNKKVLQLVMNVALLNQLNVYFMGGLPKTIHDANIYIEGS